MTSVDTMGATDLFAGVNRPADRNNLSDLEKKHIPVIEAPDHVKKGRCFQLTVEVGKMLPHPNEHNHFIQFVDIYADDTFLARADFTPVRICPRIGLCIALQHDVKQLRAYGNCNLHGVWVGTKRISVTE